MLVYLRFVGGSFHQEVTLKKKTVNLQLEEQARKLRAQLEEWAGRHLSLPASDELLLDIRVVRRPIVRVQVNARAHYETIDSPLSNSDWRLIEKAVQGSNQSLAIAKYLKRHNNALATFETLGKVSKRGAGIFSLEELSINRQLARAGLPFRLLQCPEDRRRQMKFGQHRARLYKVR